MMLVITGAERRGSTIDNLLDPCSKPAEVAERMGSSSYKCQIESRCRCTRGQHSQEMKVTPDLPRLRIDLGMQGNKNDTSMSPYNPVALAVFP